MAARIDSGSLETYGAVQSAGADIAVPDAALLFTGDYSRAGTDLVLTGTDGAKFVVTGYFDSDTPPNLVSPDGAMLTGDVASALAGPQFPGQYAQAATSDAQGAQAIGKVQSVEGGATVVRADGTTETLEAGDPVFQGDVVQTGPGSKLGIGFVDGTVFSLSANARMVLNNLVYNPDGADNSMLFSLVEGTFVFAAGQIAPTGDMKINTPVATMGIRGTSGVVEIEAANGPTNFKLIPDPRDGREGSYVLYNLDTGEPMGIVDNTGSVWRLTSADGTVTTFDKSEDDLLQDAEAISQINSVYNSWTNSPDGPQAGPDNNPPSSGGLNADPPPNTNENENNNNENNNDGNNQNENENEQQSGPPPEPPDFDDLPPLDEIPDDEGVTVINGTDGDDNGEFIEETQTQNPPELRGTEGDDIIFGFAGDDIITAFAGDDVVDAGDGDDMIIAGTGEGDDDYDGGNGTDTITYTSAINGVIINLVDSTVQGVDIGIDTIANLERFVTGEGDDTLVIGDIQLPDNFFWDAGGGIDTVLFDGALNADTATFEGDIENIEVVDLNKTHNNTISLEVDDFINDEEENSDNTLQFRGGVGDTVILNNSNFDGDYGSPEDLQDDFPFGLWMQSEVREIDGILFDVWEFRDFFTGDVIATAEVEQGVEVVPTKIVLDDFEVGLESAQVVSVQNGLGSALLTGDQANDVLGGSYGDDLIVGDGVETSWTQTTIPSTGQTIKVSLSTLDATNSESLVLSGFVDISPIETQNYNIAFVVDVSGSTSQGTLQAEIGAIEALYNHIVNNLGVTNANFALIAFDDDAEIVFSGPATQDEGGEEGSDFLEALQTLESGSTTNFEAALQQTISFFNSVSAGTNLVYFLSDGNPVNSGVFTDEVNTLLNSPINATIQAFGIGNSNSVSLHDLDLIDDGIVNGSAVHVEDPNQLSVELTDSGFTPAAIDHIEFLVNGEVVGTLDGSELEDTPFGLQYEFLLTDLDPELSDQVTVRVVAADDETNPTTVETTQTVEVHSGVGAHDVLLGDDGDDLLIGGDGRDFIFGDDGEDILVGGLKDDVLIGGDDSDGFVFASLGDGLDLVADFNENEDYLELTGILADPIGDTNLGDVINEYVTAITDENGDTTVSIDPDGSGNAAFSPVDIAVLQGVAASVNINVIVGDDEATVTSQAQVVA